MLNCPAVLPRPTRGVNHPLDQNLRALNGPHPSVTYLVMVSVIRATVRESQSLSLGHPYLFKNATFP